MLTITPSVASANQLFLANELSSFDPDVTLHVDIEDGNHVYNITFGMRTVRSIAAYFHNPLDFHLMVTDPSRYYNELASFNTRYCIIPYEAVGHPMREFDRIRDLGMKPGIAITMRTPVDVLEAMMPEADCFLLLTYGSPKGGMNGIGFREHSLERIRRVKEMLPPGKSIIVDGGIELKELHLCYEAGADTAVLGRMLFPEKSGFDGHDGRLLLPSERAKQPAELLKEILSEFE